MHEDNIFLTLTYDEQNLKSAKLVYNDFQTFVKDLRTHIFQNQLDKMYPGMSRETQRNLFKQFHKTTKDMIHDNIRISIFVTGEYGDKNKRPHWHACIFNYKPTDAAYKYSNDRGDKIYTSQTLTDLWRNGNVEFGAVTFESAGYCARYAAKKLNHGKDGEHDYEPISKKSARNAIGKKFIEKYWESIFNIGKIILPNGDTTSIPRYYEKWLKKHQPQAFQRYVTQLKLKIIEEATEKEKKITLEEKKINLARSGLKGLQTKREHVRKKILENKFKQLQQNLKL